MGGTEHRLGGIVAYSVFFVIALAVTLTLKFWQHWDVSKVPIISLNIWQIALCFLTAMLAGLWPDVDIKSKGQKIFYRIFIVLNIILMYLGFYRGERQYINISAILGLFAMMPLIGKHRGWTHSWITMFLLPGIFLLVPMCNLNLDNLKLNNFNDIAQPDYTQLSGLPFYIAAVLGYASHLYLDGILFKSPTFLKRKKRRRKS